LVRKLDETPAKLKLEDIVHREKATPDGFIPYIAELLGRFVGGVIASLSS
jgi:hypothetical protein